MIRPATPSASIAPPCQPVWRLRPALPADSPALHAACMPEAEPAFVDRLLRHCQQAALNRRGLGLVAVLPDNRLVGFGQLTLWPRAAEVSDLIVAEAWRSRGIGTTIITRLIQAAREMAVDEIEIGVALRNYRALQLYRRLGFNYGRTLDLDLGSGLEPVMYLWMALTPTAESYPASPSIAMRSPSSVT
ncbi:MAG: GNAT family N-acetyltransferase [Anaerolineae bacterium]|nr:GNAT family N-acetyltransferase [Anaerolineae bacterium]